VELDVVGEGGGEPEVGFQDDSPGVGHRLPDDHVGRPGVGGRRRDRGEGVGPGDAEALDDVEDVGQQGVPLEVGLGSVQMQEPVALDVGGVGQDDPVAPHSHQAAVAEVHEGALGPVVDEGVGVEARRDPGRQAFQGLGDETGHRPRVCGGVDEVEHEVVNM